MNECGMDFPWASWRVTQNSFSDSTFDERYEGEAAREPIFCGALRGESETHDPWLFEPELLGKIRLSRNP